MLCPECRSPNPDTNRFCGQCGHPLVQPKSNYPREGYDEADVPLVSNVGPEIADLNPRIPANEYAPPPRSEPVLHDAAESEPARNSERVRGTYRPNLTAPIFDLEPREDFEAPEPVTATGRFETDPHAVAPIATSSQTSESERASERATVGAVYGPSFLGLGEPDFLDELEEPSSNARRNWLIFALLAVIAIAAVQWRSIRDTGLRYAGTMHLKLPLKNSEQAQKPSDNGAVASGETSAAGAGDPEIVVNPTNNSAQPNQQVAQDSSDQSKPSDNSTKENSAASNTAKAGEKSSNDPASKSSNAHSNDMASAKSKADESTSISDETSADASDDNNAPDEKPAAPAKHSASKQAVKKAKPSVSAGGAEDLARAETASDPATAANWLWAATKKGNSEAPVRLADLYANGRGVPTDCEQATVLLRSSSSHGNPRAQARLGMYYATGKCVELDRAQAWHWLTLAHEADPGSDWIEQYRARLWVQMSAAERARSGGSRSASE